MSIKNILLLTQANSSILVAWIGNPNFVTITTGTKHDNPPPGITLDAKQVNKLKEYLDHWLINTQGRKLEAP